MEIRYFFKNSSFLISLIKTITNHYKDSTCKKSEFNIILAGGDTPKELYKILGKRFKNQKNISFYLSDERILPTAPTLPNFLMIDSMLNLDRNRPVYSAQSKISEMNVKDAVCKYTELISEIVSFDLAILGIGEDGHTASLFPGNFLGDSEDSPDVLPVINSPKLPSTRITLSLNKINQTDHVIILAKGSSKMSIINEILNGNDLPAAKVKGKLSTTIYYLTDNI
ncbi:6-phosphogluconolactonase [Leptospira yanagawae]|uniref:6-phosphogluconolactonase n=1 Tax=Leptospira yanagawae TaxID=293069 RepID=A0ABY2LWU8_9LEPT|nr:6-phosphogluconolactonase [Leptospira yanagawae]TGL16963.1 6-phosphogluconolactonase [Leptospira yanagawae]